VGCCGGHVRITSTPKNFEMVIGGLGGIEMGVRCQKGKGFGRESIHKICGSVKALNPVNQRKARLK
jgi:hypothetical protein